MRPILVLFLVLNVCTAIGQTAKTDPYFVRSNDTVSTRGPGSITRFMLLDSKDNIWLATWQGIVKYDGKVFTNYTLKNNLIPFHVYSVFEDRSGNIWFGTIRGGAYRYDGNDFTLFTKANGLPDDVVTWISEDKSGGIWFGTDAGVSRLDTSKLGRYRQPPALMFGPALPSKLGFQNYSMQDGLCGDRINAIIQDRNGKIWIATRSGVCTFDGKSFRHFLMADGKVFTNVRSLKEDKKGRIWIGGQEGLYCYDPELHGAEAYTRLMTNFIGYIFEDRAGHLWVNAGEPRGMALYRYDGIELTKITEKNSEGDNQIFEIIEDQKGNIWFGTMRGPCLYDGNTFSYFR